MSAVKQYITYLIHSFLCCFSQIMLQRSAVTGLFFMVGIDINSPIMLFGATTAVLSALLVAQLFQFNTYAINNGLYSFNAALVGTAVFFFFQKS